MPARPMKVSRRAPRGPEAGDLGQAAGHQGGPGVEPKAQAVADAGGDGEHVLDGSADLDADQGRRWRRCAGGWCEAPAPCGGRPAVGGGGRRRSAGRRPPPSAKLGPERRRRRNPPQHLGHHLVGQVAAAGFKTLHTQTSGTALPRALRGFGGGAQAGDGVATTRSSASRTAAARSVVTATPGAGDSPAEAPILALGEDFGGHVGLPRPQGDPGLPAKAMASAVIPRRRRRDGDVHRPQIWVARTKPVAPSQRTFDPAGGGGLQVVEGDPLVGLEGQRRIGLVGLAHVGPGGGDDHCPALAQGLFSTQARLPSASRTLVQPSRRRPPRPARIASGDTASPFARASRTSRRPAPPPRWSRAWAGKGPGGQKGEGAAAAWMGTSAGACCSCCRRDMYMASKSTGCRTMGEEAGAGDGVGDDFAGVRGCWGRAMATRGSIWSSGTF